MDHFMRLQNRLHSHALPPPTRLLLATQFFLHSFKGALHPPIVTMYHPKGLYTVVRCKTFQHFILCVCLCTLCCIILTEKPTRAQERTHSKQIAIEASLFLLYYLKCWNSLSSKRLEMVFMECNVPHVNQPAYKKKVSCADAIFGTQEVIAKYLKGGSRVYMCLYDLQ